MAEVSLKLRAVASSQVSMNDVDTHVRGQVQFEMRSGTVILGRHALRVQCDAGQGF